MFLDTIQTPENQHKGIVAPLAKHYSTLFDTIGHYWEGLGDTIGH